MDTLPEDLSPRVSMTAEKRDALFEQTGDALDLITSAIGKLNDAQREIMKIREELAGM